MKNEIEIDKPETFKKLIAKCLHARHRHLLNPNLRGAESVTTIIDDVTTSVWVKLNNQRRKGVEIESLSSMIYLMAHQSLIELLIVINGRRYAGEAGVKSGLYDELPLNFESIDPVDCNGPATVELSRVLDELDNQVDGDLHLNSILNEGTGKEQFAKQGIGERDGYFRLDKLRVRMNRLRLDGVI